MAIPVTAQSLQVIERQGWSFDRSDLQWPHWADPVQQRKDGKLNNPAGWVEYDIQIDKSGWYNLWQTGVPTNWVRDILVDGKVYLRLHQSTREDSQKVGDTTWIKECNLYLTSGKHTLQFRRFSFPGSLPHAWQLRASNDEPEGSIHAKEIGHRVVTVGQPVKLQITSGTTIPLQYTLVLKDLKTGALQDGPTLEFSASTKPQQQIVSIKPVKQGVFHLLAKCGDQLLKPSDLSLGQIIAIDKTAATTLTQSAEQLVVDIDCTSKQAENFFENSTPSEIVIKPFGTYRQTTGPDLNAHWGVQSFAYRVNLPDHDHVYKLVVDYPDDDRRTMGFWVNDGAKISNSTGNTVTGGVETGDRYPLSQSMIRHEAIFYPRNHKDVVIAVVNLAPGYKAAASRIRVYQIQGTLPAAELGQTRGRKMGYYFEESGRWLKHFGGDSSDLNEQMLTMQRWAQRNRMMGANLMMPTINVYQSNHFPSDVLLGYFNRPDDECRMAALIAQQYGSKFVPEFHLSGQVNFDRIVMGVWVENKKVMFANDQARDMVHINRDGTTNGPWKPYVYNVLHPKVQQIYLDVFGELADRLGDCESFAGISSRLMLSWQWQGWNALPGLTVGYSDWTITQFEKETGIKVPCDPTSRQRYQQRFNFLTGPKREQWIKWRCEKVFAFHQKLRDRIRQAKSDAQLFLPYHGVGRNTCLSNDPIQELYEIGIDPNNYISEPGIVLLPNAMYGRRRSTPLSDSRKWEQAIGTLAGTLGKLGGRGFALYSDYFEVNKHFDWTKIGGKPYSAFDACTPSGVHERELYAVALAENDSSFLVNGGNGHIFGSPSVMTPFLREYRALPDVQFEPLPAKDGGRDPVAVWQKKHQNQLFFYAVNRLSEPVEVRLQLANVSNIRGASDDQIVNMDSQGCVSFTLQPYMLKTFVSPDQYGHVVTCQAQTTTQFQRKVTDVIDKIKTLRDQVASRQVGIELSEDQYHQAMTLMDDAIKACEKGAYWQAWSNLFRPIMVHLYDLTGDYPQRLFARLNPLGLQDAQKAPKLKLVDMVGDVRGHLDSVDALAHDQKGNLYVSSQQQVMCFDPQGQYLRSLTLTEPHELPTGDISKYPRLDPPKYIANIRMMTSLPGDKLAIVKGWGTPGIYETQKGRLVQSLESLPGRVYDHIAVDSTENFLFHVTHTAKDKGLYRIPDGWASLDNATRLITPDIRGIAVGSNDRIYLTSNDKVTCYSRSGERLFESNVDLADGPKCVTVSSDNKLLFIASNRGATLACYRLVTSNTQSPLIKLWDKNMQARWISSLAMRDAKTLTVGLVGPSDQMVVRQLQVNEKNATLTEFKVPSLDLLSLRFLQGHTQLKQFQGSIYFISNNNLCELIPGKKDQIKLVHKTGVQRTEIHAFAFAPNGDLYLASNSGFVANTRGTNVYVLHKNADGWDQPQMLNDGKPLVANPYMIPTDMLFDDQGRLIIQHIIPGIKTRGPHLMICALELDGLNIKANHTVLNMGNSFGWGNYGLHLTDEKQLLIAGGATREIASVSLDGKIQFKTLFTPHQGQNVLPLREPTGITMDPQKRIWVSDTGRNQILCFDPQGRLLGRYGYFGNDDDRENIAFSNPVGLVAVTLEGKTYLYVADINNQRILKLEVN